MARQDQISNWLTLSRAFYTDALALFQRFQALALEAKLTGRVVVGAQGVETNLTPEQCIGAHADLDLEAFVGAFAGLAATFAAVDDDLVTLMLDAKS